MKPMKLMKPFNILLVSLFLLQNNLSAQTKQIGFDIGFGKTTYTDSQSPPHISPFNRDNKYLSDYFKFGLVYQYTPKKVFIIKTGSYYEHRGDYNVSYLKVPFGFDLALGGTIKFVFGVGIYSGILLKHSGEIKPAIFNLGASGNFGIGFTISSNSSLNIGYQKNGDLSKFYEFKTNSPGGAKYSIYYKGFDGFYFISMKFNLTKK
jgi:hypothetical protein